MTWLRRRKIRKKIESQGNRSKLYTFFYTILFFGSAVAPASEKVPLMNENWQKYQKKCSYFYSIPDLDKFIGMGDSWQSRVNSYKVDIVKFTRTTCDQYLKANQENGTESLQQFLEAQKPIMENLKPIEMLSPILQSFLTQNYDKEKAKWKRLNIDFSKLNCGKAFYEALKQVQAEKAYILTQNQNLQKCVAKAMQPKPENKVVRASAFQSAPPAAAQSAKGLDVQRSDITKRRPASTDADTPTP